MANGREKRAKRKMKPVFLVFCEGETEENYIDFVRRQYKSPIKIVPKTEGNKISQNLISKHQKELKLSQNEQISTFLMCDLDVAPIVEKLKSCKAVWLCSNPCIELWFLLHCKEHTSYITTKNCNTALSKAHVDWKNYQKPFILEAQQKFLWDNKDVAVDRAKTLEETKNPSSTIYKLLEAIEKYK